MSTHFPQLDLSIIIVNWNSVAFLRQCLASIYGSQRHITFEVLVVDNASGDGCEEMLRREFLPVRFFQSGSNIGFACANNLGYQYSTGRNVLFLNPDTEVLGFALERMVRVLDQSPQAAMVGPKLLNSDGSMQTSCIRSFPTILNEALDSEYLRRLFPGSRLWGTGPMFAQDLAPVAVDAVSGASLMIRRNAFDKVGLFTTVYFMYAEDVDLCSKVREAGWVNLFVPDATVVHHGGQSTQARDDGNFADVVLRESRLRYFKRRRGALYAACFRAAITIMAATRLVLVAGLWMLPAAPERRSSTRASFQKWVRIFRWSIGMERWAGRLPQYDGAAGGSQTQVAGATQPSGTC